MSVSFFVWYTLYLFAFLFPYLTKTHINYYYPNQPTITAVEVYEELMRILNEKTRWQLKTTTGAGGGYEPESMAWPRRLDPYHGGGPHHPPAPEHNIC